MSENGAARILVVDNDERVGKDISEICALHNWAVHVVVGAPGELVRQARVSAAEFRPHVAIVDVRLLDDYGDDRSGLKVLEDLGSARCILYSGYLTVDIVRSAQRTYAHIEEVIGKNESPDMLERTIRQALCKSSARYSHHRIEWRTGRPLERLQRAPLGDAGVVTQEMVEDLLCRLFPDAATLVIDSINQSELPQGLTARTDSLVVKVTRDNLQPVALRLAPANRIEDEVQRYRTYIDQRLAGLFYAQLMTHALFWQIGGAVYAFLGAAQSELPTFSDFYLQKEDAAAIVKPVRTFISQTWKRYYDQAEPAAAPTLFAAYDRALRLAPKLEALAHDPLLEQLPLNPVAWVRQNLEASHIPSARQAVTHGDLHGDNLFVDDEHAWVIDFERCGSGPILRDCVELEVDILTRLLQVDEEAEPLYNELVQLLAHQSRPEQVLICPAALENVSALYKAFCVIIHIRKLAHDMTQFSDMREYRWGVLLDALFAASLATATSKRRLRALKMASIYVESL